MEAEILYNTLKRTNESLQEIAVLLDEMRPGRVLSAEEKTRITEELKLREQLLLDLRNTRTPPTAVEAAISDILAARRAVVFRP